MKLSKERIVYAAVLGCGLVLLVLDRAILSPAGANAAATDDYSVAKADDADLMPIPDAVASGAPSLATRLSADNSDWQQNLRNGFLASEQWIPPPPPPEKIATPETDLVAAFAAAHTLSATQGPRSPVPGALIDGKFRKIGEAVEGWTLIEVSDFAAVFTRDELRVELKLNNPMVSGMLKERTEPEAPSPAPGNP